MFTEDKKGTTKGPEVQQPSKPFGNTDELVSNQANYFKSVILPESRPGKNICPSVT